MQTSIPPVAANPEPAAAPAAAAAPPAGRRWFGLQAWSGSHWLSLLIVAALLAALLTAVFTRWSGTDIRAPDATAVQTRLLKFDDGPEGSVLVIDATTGVLAARLEGEQGFLRGTLRAMARERRRAGSEATAEQPLELVLRSDGRLTLHDPVTRQRIDLESFGPTNAAVFARLLAP